MNSEYKLFYEAFSDHMNQYDLTLDQCIEFINGDDSAVPSETYTALADAYNMWQSARRSVINKDKQAIAGRLKDAIQWYSTCTAEEHVTQKATSVADEAWNEIIDLINDLAN